VKWLCESERSACICYIQINCPLIFFKLSCHIGLNSVEHRVIGEWWPGKDLEESSCDANIMFLDIIRCPAFIYLFLSRNRLMDNIQKFVLMYHCHQHLDFISSCHLLKVLSQYLIAATEDSHSLRTVGAHRKFKPSTSGIKVGSVTTPSCPVQSSWPMSFFKCLKWLIVHSFCISVTMLVSPLEWLLQKNFFISVTLTSTHFNPLELL
jgi:hypothetical protein